MHGIVLVRGDAVGVLVVLRAEGKPYLLLVRQPRFAISEPESLEMPAGILDWSSDFRKVALSELKEEAMIDAKDEELIDLTEERWTATPGAAGFWTSAFVCMQSKER